jgi:hypothetical protein
VKIYLAARYDRREEMLEYARQLREDGHEITSRWIYGHDVPDGLPPQESFRLHQQYAQEDLDDVYCSRVFILFSDPPGVGVRGGKHVETGYALALWKRCFVVGRRENIFHYLQEVELHETFDSVRELLRDHKESDDVEGLPF